jgi:RecA-family ATPase
MFGKAIKISFPGEDGLDLWLRASHDADKAAKRWDNATDFKPEYVEGMRTLHWYLDGDISWMFREMLGCPMAPRPLPSPLPVGSPLPEGWHWTEEGKTERDKVEDPATERRSLRDRRVNAASLAGKPVPERQWLVPGWIPMEQVTLLYGDGAVGKSLLALLLGAAAATGTHWFGQPVKQGPVEFITAEDSEGELHRRLDDISRETKQPLENMRYLNVSSFADEDAIMAALNGDGHLVKTAFYDEVVEVVQDAKPVLLVLDTLADIYGGNEVVRAQARAFVNMLRKIAIAHQLAVVVLAHPSLDGMRTGKGTSGSTGWSNSVRSRLYLDRVYDDQGMEPDTDARVLRSMKMNYGSVGNEIRMRWRAGIFVPVAGASSGDPVVTAARAERVFLELLAKFTEQNRYVSVSEGKSYAPFVFASEATKQGVSKRALKEAMERLINRKKIENAPYGAPSKKMFRLYVIDLPTPANGMPTHPKNGVSTPANALPTAANGVCVLPPLYPHGANARL